MDSEQLEQRIQAMKQRIQAFLDSYGNPGPFLVPGHLAEALANHLVRNEAQAEMEMEVSDEHCQG